MDRTGAVSVVLGKHVVIIGTEKLGRVKNESERMAALLKFMDSVTDPKLVREAKVYRPVLVNCE